MLLVEGILVKPLFEEDRKKTRSLKIGLQLYVSSSGTTEACICTTEVTSFPCENITSITSTANTYPSEPCDCTSVTTVSSAGISKEIISWINFDNSFIFSRSFMHACVFCPFTKGTSKQYI
jgi:hypothetical protein